MAMWGVSVGELGDMDIINMAIINHNIAMWNTELSMDSGFTNLWADARMLDIVKYCAHI